MPHLGAARVAGIDPGAKTGMVCLYVPRGEALDEHLSAARWVGSASIRSGELKGCSDAENDARLYARIRAQLEEWRAELVVIEEPWDTVSVRLQQQGTAFGLGKAYGLALAAARTLGARVVSWPVRTVEDSVRRTNQRLVKGHTGWMPTWRKGGKGMLMVQDRDITLHQLDALSRLLRARPAGGLLAGATLATNLPMLSEDERMALGVLRFHLLRQPHL